MNEPQVHVSMLMTQGWILWTSGVGGGGGGGGLLVTRLERHTDTF